jgi:large subunit ribosomal protein L11
MAKKIKTQIKVNLPAGAATPAPPLGPTLAQHGIPIMDFVKAYNDKTADQRGNTIPCVITVYEDRSFDFELKLPPVSAMILKALGAEKGAGDVKKKPLSKALTMDQAREIAEKKIEELNANDVDGALKTVLGTARSMGVKVQ